MWITYRADFDVPVWMVDEVINGKRVARWWNVRLWTGEIMSFKSKRAAVAAYWR